ncbi:hypothetical protein [Streptomyces sp. NPDC057582]|uniref:hypothetical protein n=1 Tax=unclassified Streptomyces TaxID=2593676 RepID=UPI0036A8F56E
MTACIRGEHDFPVEDEMGAYCEEHGVTLLWHGPLITAADLGRDDASHHEKVVLDEP